MRPRPWVAMKLMASGVTNWAAMRQVALVLAILVVDEDDHLAGAHVGDGAGDALGELRVDRPHGSLVPRHEVLTG